ncbi:MAG: SDR family NAD(P)-dependent oxidoreductase [Bacteroidales bacterium]|nr:SDR family NAD(P)-dependent oxidoreductase [Bacteroidales bacterium]
MRKEGWTIEHIPQQAGRIAIVTGANSGLGYNTTRALAVKGARVIMACRNLEKGEMARLNILAEGVAVEPEVWHLDLASLESVKQFAQKFTESGDRLDLLINNAGLMAIPYHRTEDGFEMQFGVNHLGHFALTARLWPLLSKTEGSRVVQVSSLAHYWGKIRFEDIHWEKGYKKWSAYGMSKLANLLFVRELALRLAGTDRDVTVAAAHPGYADTELQAKGSRMKGSWLGAGSFNLANRLMAQTAEMGALPLLYAATAIDVEQGAFYGPGGWLKMHGWPVLDSPSQKLVTGEVAGKLWDVSESLTGIEFRI